jgi:O-antigen ligase
MSSASVDQTPMLHLRAAAALLLLLVALFCVLLTLVLTESMVAGAAVVFLFAVVGVLLLVFGFAGAIALAAVLCAFLLMARFDEGWALPVDHIIKIKLTHLITTGCVFALGLASIGRAFGGAIGTTPVVGRAQRRLALGLCLFALFALVMNHLYDSTVPHREINGELLALIAVLVPVAFVWQLPHSRLSKGRALLALRALILLGGLAGLIMGMFGLLPGAVLGALGWSGATGGTIDLVRGRLPLGHPNTVAAVMLLLLPPAVVLGLNDRNLLWRPIYLACVLSMFGGTLFALSRAALMVMLLSVGATVAYLFFTQKQYRVLMFFLLSGILVVFVGITAFLFSTMDFSRFWSRGYAESASVERRYESLVAALAVWRDHPLLGVSPDAVYTRLDLRPDWEPPTSDIASPIVYYRGMPSAETPHNMYLTAFAELGTPGAFLFFLLILSTLLQLYGAQARLADTGQRRIIVGFMLGLGSFMLMGMFEALLMTSLRAATIFWVFAGLSLRYAALSAPEFRPRDVLNGVPADVPGAVAPPVPLAESRT